MGWYQPSGRPFEVPDGLLELWKANRVQVFNAAWDADFYQAFSDQIADHAVKHQRLGGFKWNTERMTW